nr:hypothetical protein [Pandoravirus aubagnensis]
MRECIFFIDESLLRTSQDKQEKKRKRRKAPGRVGGAHSLLASFCRFFLKKSFFFRHDFGRWRRLWFFSCRRLARHRKKNPHSLLALPTCSRVRGVRVVMPMHLFFLAPWPVHCRMCVGMARDPRNGHTRCARAPARVTNPRKRLEGKPISAPRVCQSRQRICETRRPHLLLSPLL